MADTVRGMVDELVGSLQGAYTRLRAEGIDEAAALFALRAVGFSWAHLARLFGAQERFVAVLDQSRHRAESFGVYGLRVWRSPSGWIMIIDSLAEEYLIPPEPES